MRSGKFNEDQIIEILKETYNGAPLYTIYQKYNINQRVFFQWRKQYDNLDIPTTKRLSKLADINKRLKDLYVKTCHHNQMLQHTAEAK